MVGRSRPQPLKRLADTRQASRWDHFIQRQGLHFFDNSLSFGPLAPVDYAGAIKGPEGDPAG